GARVCSTTTSPDRPASRASALSQLGESRSDTRMMSPPARLVNEPSVCSRSGGEVLPNESGVAAWAGLNSSMNVSMALARPRPQAGPYELTDALKGQTNRRLEAFSAT